MRQNFLQQQNASSGGFLYAPKFSSFCSYPLKVPVVRLVFQSNTRNFLWSPSQTIPVTKAYEGTASAVEEGYTGPWGCFPCTVLAAQRWLQSPQPHLQNLSLYHPTHLLAPHLRHKLLINKCSQGEKVCTQYLCWVPWSLKHNQWDVFRASTGKNSSSNLEARQTVKKRNSIKHNVLSVL